VVTYVIPLGNVQWHSKNVEDWIIRSEATFIDILFKKVWQNIEYYFLKKVWQKY